jgi:hypothetical protein
MVFADLKYSGTYEDAHDYLHAFLQSRFDRVEGGLQSDSCIWIWFDEDKVAVDTFSATNHQIKSSRSGSHVERVIEALKQKYNVAVYPQPVIEPHEDEP